MDEERRTKLKLSSDARRLWEETEAAYASVESMGRRETFDQLRRRLALLPENQRRYYRRLMRLNSAERFERAALLSLSEEDFGRMVEDATPERLAFIAGELCAACCDCGAVLKGAAA